jgi:hypothetical protein
MMFMHKYSRANQYPHLNNPGEYCSELLKPETQPNPGKQLFLIVFEETPLKKGAH